MLNKKCSECGKDIKIPQCSADEGRATGVLCQCIEKPMCFNCNMENIEIHNEQSDKCCAFGFPKVGDWFYPKEDYKKMVRLSIHNYRRGGSMICDEEKSRFDNIPSADKISKKILQHKKKYGVEPVYFSLDGVA